MERGGLLPLWVQPRLGGVQSGGKPPHSKSLPFAIPFRVRDSRVSPVSRLSPPQHPLVRHRCRDGGITPFRCVAIQVNQSESKWIKVNQSKKRIFL